MDKEIEKALKSCGYNPKCGDCPYYGKDIRCGVILPKDALDYINRLKFEKQLAETQLKELLSALYRRTEKPFTLERKDIVELAKDYGIKEEELK